MCITVLRILDYHLQTVIVSNEMCENFTGGTAHALELGCTDSLVSIGAKMFGYLCTVHATRYTWLFYFVKVWDVIFYFKILM